MSWSTAQNYIIAMNAANYLGFLYLAAARHTKQPDPSCTSSRCCEPYSSGFGCTGSEMGHLFYNELGGSVNTHHLRCPHRKL